MSFACLSIGLALLAAIPTVVAGDIVGLGNVLPHQCRFMVDGNKFDLCPILERNEGKWGVAIEQETPPTLTTTRYHLSLTGPIPKDGTLPDNLQCPEGTWICMIVESHYPDSSSIPKQTLQTVPVAGMLSKEHCSHIIKQGEYYPGLNITAQMARLSDVNDDVLSVRLNGGYYVDKPQSATVNFLCDPGDNESNLQLSHASDGTHVFRWSSKHFCATRDPEPEPKPEEELISSPINDRSSRIWTILLSSGCTVGILAYLVYKPPKTLRRRVQSFLRDHPSLLRFRVGENVLVRWAHEELELEEEEEDHMINDDGMDYFGIDEQIPLKPSPRKGFGGRLHGYGAAR